jgi:hypothetical protein
MPLRIPSNALKATTHCEMQHSFAGCRSIALSCHWNINKATTQT